MGYTGSSVRKFGALAFLLIALSFAAGCAQQGYTGNVAVQGGQEPAADEIVQSADETAPELDPSRFAVRQRYFEEAFQPNRNSYRLFEKAAAFLGIPLNQVPGYFSLNSENEVFAELPAVPADFSEVAFLLANGETYAIGGFSHAYF